jgi:hypothetical protein
MHVNEYVSPSIIIMKIGYKHPKGDKRPHRPTDPRPYGPMAQRSYGPTALPSYGTIIFFRNNAYDAYNAKYA